MRDKEDSDERFSKRYRDGWGREYQVMRSAPHQETFRVKRRTRGYGKGTKWSCLGCFPPRNTVEEANEDLKVFISQRYKATIVSDSELDMPVQWSL